MALVGWSCNTIFGLMLLAAPSPKPNYSAALDEKSGKSIYGMSLWLSSTICVSRLSSIILFSSNFAPLVFVYVYILHFSIRIRFAISIGLSSTICVSRLSSIILFSSNFAPLVFVYVYILHFSIRIRFAISIGVSICPSIRLELRIGGRAKTSDEGQKGPLFSRFYDGAKSKTDLRSSKC